MARKNFNFVPNAECTAVIVQRLGYTEGEASAHVVEEVEFALADLPEQFQNGEGVMSLAVYGLSQILQDRAAPCQTDEKLAQMAKTFETLKSGLWKEARVSTGGGAKKPSIDTFFAQAFVALAATKGKEITVEQAVLVLQDMDSDTRKAVRQTAEIKEHIEKAKAAAASAVEDFNLEDLFS